MPLLLVRHFDVYLPSVIQCYTDQVLTRCQNKLNNQTQYVLTAPHLQLIHLVTLIPTLTQYLESLRLMRLGLV